MNADEFGGTFVERSAESFPAFIFQQRNSKFLPFHRGWRASTKCKFNRFLFLLYDFKSTFNMIKGVDKEALEVYSTRKYHKKKEKRIY